MHAPHRLIGLAAPARAGKDTVAALLRAVWPEAHTYAFALPLKLGCQVLFGLSDAETWSEHTKEQALPDWGYSPRALWQTVGTDWMRRRNRDHWLRRAERALTQFSRPAHDPAPPPSDPQDPHSALRCAAQAFWGLSPAQAFDPAAAAEPDPLWGLTPAAMVAALAADVRQAFPDFTRQRQRRPAPGLLSSAPAVTLPRRTLIITDTRFDNEADFIRRAGGTVWHIDRASAPAVRAHVSEQGVARLPGDRVIDNNGTLDDLRRAVRAAAAQTPA